MPFSPLDFETKDVKKTITFFVWFVVLFALGAILRPFADSYPIEFTVAGLFIVSYLNRILKAPIVISFLVGGFLTSLLLGVPLLNYANLLVKSAGSSTLLLIALSGAVIALLDRKDLQDALANEQRNNIHPYREKELKGQIEVYCFLKRFKDGLERLKYKHSGFCHILSFFQTIIFSCLFFVSSVVAVRGLGRLLDAAEDRSKNIGRYHAGILCICVAGCLMVFKLSPWWLYFNELVPESDFFPFGVYFFALASLIHGYKLVFYSTPSGSTNIPIPETASPISMKKKQQKMSLNSKKKKFIQVKPSFTNGVLCFLSSLPSDG